MSSERLIPEDRRGEAWTSVVDVVTDVGRAIEEAMGAGAISGLGAIVLWLYYAQGQSHAEIASTLGVSVSTIQRHQRAALEALRNTGALRGYDASDECA